MQQVQQWHTVGINWKESEIRFFVKCWAHKTAPLMTNTFKCCDYGHLEDAMRLEEDVVVDASDKQWPLSHEPSVRISYKTQSRLTAWNGN